MAVSDDKVGRVRAYLEYFRDMGVHEFYRNETLEAVELPVVEAAVSVSPGLKPDARGENYGTGEPVPLSGTEDRIIAAPVKTVVPAAVTPASVGLDIAKLVSFQDLAPMPSARVPAAFTTTKR